jgi:hypothetical protein
MALADVVSEHPEIRRIAFSSNGTENADAFTVFHLGGHRKDLIIEVNSSGSDTFESYVSGQGQQYKPDGTHKLRNSAIETTLYRDTAVTFFAK